MKNFIIQELALSDLSPNLLQHFNRYQDIRRCWQMENDRWILKDISYVEQWDEELKKEIVAEDFTGYIKSGGLVWGVFSTSKKLIAFASMPSNFFGSEKQYLQLMQIHVSYEDRNRGIGRKLFQVCAEKAGQLGAKKLYISTHSSEESQYFYKSMGCVDAQEINEKLAGDEPCDRQMEFAL